mgnify:CR=1 FL=1
MLAAGHQQRAQLQLGEQREALGHQLGLVGAAADHRLELGEIRRDQAGAAVDGEVPALGVGQHRQVAGAGGLDQRLMVLQRPLAVVGEDHHLDPVE